MIPSTRGPRATDAEREVLRPVREILRAKARLSIAEWARLHIKITEGPMVGESGEPVRWSPETFPPSKTIMAAIVDNRWSQVYLMTAPQAGSKTQSAALPTILHALQHRRVSAAYVAANLALATTQWVRKIRPAIEADADLKRLLFDNPDEGGTRNRRDFTNGTSLHCAGADSVGALSGFTAPVIVCDDIQAYPATLPGFGHPVDLARTRAESFPKDQTTFVGLGTAGTVNDYLWRSVLGSAFFVPLVPCLGCGTYQMLTWDRLVFDDSSPQAAEADTWMRCVNEGTREGKGNEGTRKKGTRDRGNKGTRKSGLDPSIPRSLNPFPCDHRMTFDELPAMLRAHKWVSTPPGEDWVCGESPVRNRCHTGGCHTAGTLKSYPHTDRATDVAGFWLNALLWTLGKTWGERAAEWLGRVGNPDKEKDHQQNVRVIPWVEPDVDEEKLTEAEMEEHTSKGYAAGTVPAAADVVTVTVDVQSGYIYWLARAWKKSDGTTWLIDLGTIGKPLKNILDEDDRKQRRIHGISTSLDAVNAKCAEGFPIMQPNGEISGVMHPSLVLVDRGFEGDMIASWCNAKGRGLWKMILGAKAGQHASLWPKLARKDGRGRPFRFINVNHGKTTLRRLLRILAGQPGYWHLPETGLHANTLRAYFRHMASERWDKTRRIPAWLPVKPGAANHFWDTEVYQIAAAVAVGVRLPSLEVAERKPPVTDRFTKQRERRDAR